MTCGNWVKAISCLCIILICSSIKASTRKGIVYINNNQSLKEQLTGSNVVYEIHSEIDLKTDTIRIPENCELRFKKGRIQNGVILFNNTKLTGKVDIQSEIKGKVSNDAIYTDWFFKGETTTIKLEDSSKRIQDIFNLGTSNVIFGSGYYRFANIQIGKDRIIEGDNTIIIPISLNQKEYDFNFLKNVFYTQEAQYICIKDLHFQGRVSGAILPEFRSNTLYGEPLIWVDKGDKVVIERCVFKDIENCTYCNTAYNYYGKKQGSCVCLWDVSDASYINCEQNNCRHDEQVWMIAVNKPIAETKMTYTGNYIHDMTPGPNSSAFTCVTGTCQLENNKVDRYSYPGSMFNVFAKKAIIRSNEITNSYCSSVFDACEYSFFHNDEIIVEDNKVDAINSILVVGQSEKVMIRNNEFRGLGLYCSGNNRIEQKMTGRYKYWYSKADEIIPTDSETIIDHNICDFTGYDGNRSIAGTQADYGTGKIIEPQKYNNVGVNYGCGILIHPHEMKAGSVKITNNSFVSLQSFNGVIDKNILANIFPHAIRLVNTENVIIKGNVFKGSYRVYQNPNIFTCITVYNYPDEMETLTNPKGLSQNPSEYGKYVIEDNSFDMQNSGEFYPVCFYPRVNSFRQTQLTVKELVVKNNSIRVNGVLKKVNKVVKKEQTYVQSGPVKILKQVVK